MKVIKYLLILFMLASGTSVYASHVIGYDMTLINIKDGSGNPTDTYKFRLRFFRDVTGIAIPASFAFNIYRNSDNGAAGNFTVNKINPQTFLTYPPEDCPPDQAQLRVELGIYESPVFNYASMNSIQGYYVVCVHNARNPGVINVLGPSDQYSVLMTMEFPRLNAGTSTRYNSSPEFRKNPLTFFCVGKPYTLNWDITDPDGDSLVYSLAQPIDDGTTKPTWQLIPYAAGYNLFYNILDGVPDLTINSKTGIINFIPTRTGKYLVSFRVEEYRNIAGVPTKIGEIRREYQLETVLCPEAPPVTEDNNNQKKVIVDTINLTEDYTITFTSRDSPTDSIFMYILPNIAPGENLLDPNTYEGKWGEIGSLSGGVDAQNLVIEGQGLIQGQFKWKPKCNQVREKPYNFTVVVRDKTCPSPFYDSTFVTLYVRKKDNISPLFANKYLGMPDTVKVSSPSNKKLKRYYIKAGETFQLAADSMIRTYDKDSSQTVNIIMIADPANGLDINGDPINSKFVFSANPGQINSTAIFKWVTTCADKLDQPVKVKFLAFDNDCLKPDSVEFSIELYIKDQPNKKPIYAHYNKDTVKIPEGLTDVFTVSIYDTVSNNEVNKYKNIELFPDLSEFAAAAVLGGNMPTYTTLKSADSLKVTFTWTPNCANVRQEPYRLYLRTADEGCPTISAYDTVYVYALGPFNSAPEFRDPDGVTYNIVDTTIYGGDVFRFNLYAVDTNQRFDSVFISLDQTSDIADPTIVSNIAYVVPAEGKDSARTELVWTTTCADIRTTPYLAKVIAKDNECVFPEINTLFFNITVRERPNFIPQFTFASTNQTIDTVYAGETYVVNLTSVDTTTGETITMDTVYTNIPFNQPKPIVNRAIGLGADTVKSTLSWFIDCSLIRNEPYHIKVASWDGACRNPQDSARHEFIIYVFPNPELFPRFASGNDTTIELVAGEKFTLDLNSRSNLPGDSILIASTSEVYGNISGNFATFEQTQVQGEGNATFYWETGCDQIRDSTYNVFFTTSNPPCKTPEESFTIKFKIIPNTDLTNPLPNVFTPNGDNKNDTYRIDKQYLVYCDPGFKFTIFNRWGKKVFESTDPNFEWKADGLGSGTYFYTLESKVRSQSGTIDIIK
jgi:gliding motility-associated-like protein